MATSGDLNLAIDTRSRGARVDGGRRYDRERIIPAVAGSTP